MIIEIPDAVLLSTFMLVDGIFACLFVGAIFGYLLGLKKGLSKQ